MNKRIKYLIGINIILLGLVSLSLRRTNQASTLDELATAFAVVDTGQVVSIKVGEVLLKRENGAAWSVNGEYLADAGRMQRLLGMLPRLEVKRPAPRHLKDSIADVLASTSFWLEVEGVDGMMNQYPLVKASGDTYSTIDDSDPYALYVPGYRQNIGDWLDVGVDGWRDRHIIYTSWRSLKSLSIEVPEEKEPKLHIFFDQDFYKIDKVSRLDTAKLYDYINQYASFEALQYVDKKADDPLFQVAPAGIIRVEDLFTKQKVALEIYPSENNTLYGWLPETEEAVLLNPNQLQHTTASRSTCV